MDQRSWETLYARHRHEASNDLEASAKVLAFAAPRPASPTPTGGGTHDELRSSLKAEKWYDMAHQRGAGLHRIGANRLTLVLSSDYDFVGDVFHSVFHGSVQNLNTLFTISSARNTQTNNVNQITVMSQLSGRQARPRSRALQAAMARVYDPSTVQN